MTYTRVTDKVLNNNIIQTIMANRTKLNDLQEQISSGKRITKASDDASAAMDVMSSNVSLNKIDSYFKNIDNANSELEVTDSSLSNLTDVITRAKELALSASNATTGSDELSAIKSELDQIIQNVKDIGNTQFGGNYIFAGLNTTTPPFQTQTDADGNVIEGEIKYTGSSSTGNYERNVEISDGITVGINVAGDSILGSHYTDEDGNLQSSGLLGTLCTLSDAIGASPTNYDDIRKTLDGIDDGLNDVLNQQSKVGGFINRLDMTKNSLEDNQITLTKFKSKAEDVDLVKAISDMSFLQTTLEASLQVGAGLMQTSLLNYL